jgi:hypothetical protein
LGTSTVSSFLVVLSAFLISLVSSRVRTPVPRQNEIELSRFLDSSKIEKITFLIWLGAFASDELEGAKISFDIEFCVI